MSDQSGDSILAAAGLADAPEPEAPEAAAAETEAPEVQAPEGGQPPADFSAFVSRFDEFASDVRGRVEAIEQRVAPAPEGEPEPEAPEAAYTMADLLNDLPDENFDEQGGLTMEGLEALITRAVNATVSQQFTQRDTQSAQEAVADRRAAGLDALEEKYPDLSDPQKAKPVLEEVCALARDIADGLPGVSWQSIAADPGLVERVYLAQKARAAAGASSDAPTPDPVPLERPGGGGPVEQAPTGDDGDRIVALASASRFRLGR
jgi:hypothetical protein